MNQPVKKRERSSAGRVVLIVCLVLVAVAVHRFALPRFHREKDEREERE